MVSTNDICERGVQGVGDKHVLLILNVMNTDVVVGISDVDHDELDGIASMPAAIKIANHLRPTGAA